MSVDARKEAEVLRLTQAALEYYKVERGVVQRAPRGRTGPGVPSGSEVSSRTLAEICSDSSQVEADGHVIAIRTTTPGEAPFKYVVGTIVGVEHAENASEDPLREHLRIDTLIGHSPICLFRDEDQQLEEHERSCTALTVRRPSEATTTVDTTVALSTIEAIVSIRENDPQYRFADRRYEVLLVGTYVFPEPQRMIGDFSIDGQSGIGLLGRFYVTDYMAVGLETMALSMSYRADSLTSSDSAVTVFTADQLFAALTPTVSFRTYVAGYSYAEINVGASFRFARVDTTFQHHERLYQANEALPVMPVGSIAMVWGTDYGALFRASVGYQHGGVALSFGVGGRF